MRTFLQKKAGATYLVGCNMTVNVRKDNFEMIFQLAGGWHAVISVFPEADNIILLAGTNGKMRRAIDTATSDYYDNIRKLPLLDTLLNPDSRYYSLVNLYSENFTEITEGIEHRMPPFKGNPIEILGDPKIIKEAKDMANYVLGLHRELRNAKIPALDKVTDCLY